MEDIMREKLLGKSWKELYQLRCDQYCSKEEIVDDIIEHDDDGSVWELLQTEGSFLWLMVQSSVKNGLNKLLDNPGESASGGLGKKEKRNNEG